MDTVPDGSSGNREGSTFLLQAHDRVTFLANSREISVIDPLALQELQGGHRPGADEQEEESPRSFVVAVRKGVRVVWRAVRGAAPDDAMNVHVREHGQFGVPRVHPAHVATERCLLAIQIVSISKVVVPLWVLAERGVVLFRRKRQAVRRCASDRTASRPAAHVLPPFAHCRAGIG